MSATFPSLGARLGKHSIALFCALLATLILLPAAARADFEETFRYDARTLTVGNLIGEVTVEGHSGSEFVVEVKVQGEDADPERILFQSKEGNVAELLIQFPVDDERRFVYPRLGSRSRTTFSPRHRRNSGILDQIFGRDRIEVRGSGRGMEAWADVKILVPGGGELKVLHGVGEIVATQTKGHLELGVRSGHVRAESIEGSLLVDTGSGHVQVEDV